MIYHSQFEYVLKIGRRSCLMILLTSLPDNNGYEKIRNSTVHGLCMFMQYESTTFQFNNIAFPKKKRENTTSIVILPLKTQFPQLDPWRGCGCKTSGSPTQRHSSGNPPVSRGNTSIVMLNYLRVGTAAVAHFHTAP